MQTPIASRFSWRRLALLLAAGLMAMTAQAQSVLTIGTGGAKGVYYPLGGAICGMVEDARGAPCKAESTAGSIYNLNAIRAGEIDLGLVQSDTQYNAYHGLAEFKGQGADQELRALFSLHDEAFTVVARKDAGIRTFDDLKGKRVNIGNPGSGQRATMEALMAAKGWTKGDFALATELESGEQSRALCDNKVDAIVYTVGHPNGSIEDATSHCDSVLIAVAGPEVDKLLSEHPYYIKTTIPGDLYRGNPNAVGTFGVKATLVSSTRTPEDTVYWVVKSAFEDFNAFRRVHPSLANLSKESMIASGNTAPLHPGAERYFREAGLLK